MFTHSASGEVFGASLLYAAIVALSTAALFVAVASPIPVTAPAGATAAVAHHPVETVVVSAPAREVS